MAKLSLIIVGIVLASWSMLVLTQQAFDHAFGGTFTELLEAYDEWTTFVVWLIGPLVRICIGAFSAWFGWPFELHPYWKHILIVLSLYMTNYISNNVGGRPLNAVTLALLMVPLAIFGAAGFGAMLSKGSPAGLAFPIIALVLFAIAASASTALFYPPADRATWPTFRYYWGRTVMPFVTIGAIMLVAAFAADRLLAHADMESFVLVLFAAFVMALALNLLLRGPSGEQPVAPKQRWRHWFSGSFGPRLGTRIISVYVLAAAQFLLDLYVLQPLDR